jgi:sulfur carrier protein
MTEQSSVTQGVSCTVNGEPRLLPADARVADVVAVLAPDATKGIAVALDGDVVPRSQWDSTRISEGAQLEVLTAVQGG